MSIKSELKNIGSALFLAFVPVNRSTTPSVRAVAEPADAGIYNSREGFVVRAGITAEQAREISAHLNEMQSTIVQLREQLAIAQAAAGVNVPF